LGTQALGNPRSGEGNIKMDYDEMYLNGSEHVPTTDIRVNGIEISGSRIRTCGLVCWRDTLTLEPLSSLHLPLGEIGWA
jgi:hypothetical protein